MPTSQPSAQVEHSGVDNIDELTSVSGNFTDGDESNPATYVITFSNALGTCNDGYWGITHPDPIGGGDAGPSDSPPALEGWSASGNAAAGEVIYTKNEPGTTNSPIASGTPLGVGQQALRYWVEGQHLEVRISTPANSIGGKFILKFDDVPVGEFPYDVDGPTLQAALGPEYDPWMVFSTTANTDGLLLYHGPTGVGPTVTVENGDPPIEVSA